MKTRFTFLMSAVLGTFVFASEAFADHTTLTCRVEGVYDVSPDKLLIEASDNQCWSDCEMKIDFGSHLQAKVNVAKKGTELRIELLSGWNSERYGVKSVVATGESTLMNCWGTSLNQDSGRRIECKYCWID